MQIVDTIDEHYSVPRVKMISKPTPLFFGHLVRRRTSTAKAVL